MLHLGGICKILMVHKSHFGTLLEWSLNQPQKSSYIVHNNFLKTELKFIMTSQGQHNDLTNTQKVPNNFLKLHHHFKGQYNYLANMHKALNIEIVSRLHSECLKSNKDYKATSYRPPIPSAWTPLLSSHCPTWISPNQITVITTMPKSGVRPFAWNMSIKTENTLPYRCIPHH